MAPLLSTTWRSAALVAAAPLTLRAAARELGVTHRTVGKRTIVGVAQLAVWSGLSEQQVTEGLRRLRIGM